MKYTKYEIETGKLISNIFTSADVSSRLKEGEGVLEGWYDPARFVYTDGTLVEIEVEEVFNEVESNTRLKRDICLKESDWTQLPDVPLATKQAWATYRQALRDLPTHVNWPNLADEDWPIQP